MNAKPDSQTGWCGFVLAGLLVLAASARAGASPVAGFGTALANLGHALRQQNRHQQAAEVLEQAVLADPENVGLLTALCASLVEVRRLDDAETAIKRAIAAVKRGTRWKD